MAFPKTYRKTGAPDKVVHNFDEERAVGAGYILGSVTVAAGDGAFQPASENKGISETGTPAILGAHLTKGQFPMTYGRLGLHGRTEGTARRKVENEAQADQAAADGYVPIV